MRRKLRPTDRGLTLLELVVAVFILAVGSMAALRAVDQSRLALGGAEPRLLAQLAVRNRAEELRLVGLEKASTLPSRVTLGRHSFTLSTEVETTAGGLAKVEVFARTERGPGATLVVFLPTVERGR